MKKRVLQGMRPTGKLHLGNYFGTAKGMLSLQENPEYETFYMVADLHGITTPFDPKEIRKNAKSVLIDYLSIGLDPEKSALFLQSDLADLHTQLAFYFSSVVTIARMQHLPTFKEKVKQYPEGSTMALLNYPILMASDILIYKASMVPVGLDQEPHMEVSREIARKMNEKFGTDFPEPKSLETKTRYIPSLTGQGKMSKSVEGSYISLTDDLEIIKSRLSKVATDTGKGVIRRNNADEYDEKFINKYISENSAEALGVATLMELVGLFQGEKRRTEYEDKYQNDGIRYGDLKNELAEAIYNELKPIQEKRKQFENDPKLVDRIIKEGAEKARKVASETIKEVKEKMGLA